MRFLYKKQGYTIKSVLRDQMSPAKILKRKNLIAAIKGSLEDYAYRCLFFF